MTYAAVVAEDAPVAYYRMGGASGSLADSIAGGTSGSTSGTLTRDSPGALLATAEDDGAIAFGSTGYVTIPDQAKLHLGDTLSVEFWLKQSASTGGYLVVKGTQYVISMSGQKVRVEDDTNSPFAEETTALDFGNDGPVWHHYVITHAPGSTHIYRDGVDSTNHLTVERVLSSNATALTIGAYTTGTGVFAGSIDEVAIYGTVLSATRVLAHYRAGTRHPYTAAVLDSMPVVYLPLGEAGLGVIDYTDGSVGVLVGSPTRGAAPANVRGDGATSFNGTTQWADIPDKTKQHLGNGPLSYEFWVKRTRTLVDYELVFSKGSQGNMFFLNDKMRCDDDSGASIIEESGSTTDTNWHHWVWSRKGSGSGNNNIYKDGVNVTADGSIIANTLSSGTQSIYLATQGGSVLLAGAIDEVAMYDHALSAAEVAAHYNQGRGVLPRRLGGGL